MVENNMEELFQSAYKKRQPHYGNGALDGQQSVILLLN